MDHTVNILNKNEVYLFLTVLGGRTKKSHIELHDVRWVIGSKIEDTFEQLRNEWFGDKNGLHIDSYKKVNFVDGYRVKINKRNINDKLNPLKEKSKPSKKPYLWFINLGGYSSKSMAEIHQFGLIVAKSYKEAKQKAQSRWLKNAELKHKDDIYSINIRKDIDNCYVIKNIGNWEISLIKEKQVKNQELIPDWYGFMRINNK